MSTATDTSLAFGRILNSETLKALGRAALASLVVGTIWASPIQAQHQHSPPDSVQSSTEVPEDVPLEAPGHSIFGAVQEVIRELESRPDTDWSNVNVERLRQHLLDMHRVAQKVTVNKTAPIENGVRLVVQPKTPAARESLRRVLSAHPAMLNEETGWSMKTTSSDKGFIITTTDPNGGQDTQKIRALGYVGLLSHGAHHQKHHWMIVRGKHPHHDRASSTH